MENAYQRNLEERTGRSFEDWGKLAKKDGPKEKKALLAWLRSEHGLSTNYAHWVAGGEAGGSESYDPEAFVEEMYAGPKAHLRPIYERLLDEGLGLGEDVKACPCQTMVPLYRKYVFAELKPASSKRFELGLALGDTKPAGRLETLGSRALGNRITHRIILEDESGIDGEVLRWLRAAYERGNEEKAAPKAKGFPADLKAALAKSKPAQATWDTLTDRMRQDWIGWIEQAAKPETRTRRLETTLEKLAAGKKRMY
jgi:hypothetical protein